MLTDQNQSASYDYPVISAVVRIPCDVEARYLARTVLRRPDATNAEVTLAIETLEMSRDWQDLELARMTRAAIKPAVAAAVMSDIQTAQASATHEGYAKAAALFLVIVVLMGCIVTVGQLASSNARAQAADWSAHH